MGTQARILVAVQLDGQIYQPNQVVDLPPAVAKALRTEGDIDTSKEAVAYCVDELGATVIVHQAAADVPVDVPVDAPAEAPAAEVAATV